MFYGITQLNNYMEEDIHNHTLIVMFRGTPFILCKLLKPDHFVCHRT